MRRLSSIVLVCVLPCIEAAGELQNIEVGGKIEIYAAWYSDIYEPGEPAVRIPSWWLPHRSIGPNGTLSCIRADEGNRLAFLEQRTRLYVRTDFTLEVTAFIESDSIHTWGDHFRSDYVTGADRRGDSSDDMEPYQAYIEVEELFGLPVRLRIGRQEMEFGSGWLVGADPGPDPFVGLSFDAVRLTITREPFVVDVWWSKLADRSPLEQDGDIDFLGLYATFQRNNGQMGSKGFGSFECDLYWMYLRAARSWSDSNGPALFEWIEDLSGFDDYGVTHMHTVGARCAGAGNAWDWEVEAAHQFGDADAVGFLFRPVGGVYGDARARFNSWAGHAEVGYTFPKSWTPRAFLKAAITAAKIDVASRSGNG
mgnify:CR=1 FL=1